MGSNLPDYQTWLPIIESLADEAGRIIMAVYSTDFQVHRKSDHSPLTAADMAAHHVISAGLEELTPDLPYLSEESTHIPFSERRQWQRYWLIDPLDGTREFVKRNGEFTVNIALIEGGAPILGLIHIPISNTYYFGGLGFGAFKREGDGAAQPIRCQPRHQPTVVARSHWPCDDDLAFFLDALGEHHIIQRGSSIKSCLVAEGSADVYARLGPTMEWDTAAAQAILEAAGGRITDTLMQPLRYNTKESLLNPHFFACGDLQTDWSQYLPPDYVRGGTTSDCRYESRTPP